MKNVETIRFTRRNLPHWLVADRTYFVTLRLKGTLPRSAVEELRRERNELRASRPKDDEAINNLQQQQFRKIEAILDACRTGAKWLKNSTVADVVLENLCWFESSRGWLIHAAVVMPTHVHLLMRNLEGRNGELRTDLGQFKNYTASEANRVLGREGTFWMPEDFDHWCRGPEKIRAAAEYIQDNPVKAGLVGLGEHWRWKR